MSPELDQKLFEKFPKIFSERNSDMQETAMCWGFECGDGWFHIIDKLCQNIQSRIDWNNKRRLTLLENNPYDHVIPDEVIQVVATQVKEKFGTLRFYYDGGDATIDGMVRMAESMSSVTCEVCGMYGTTGGKGWVRTLCEIHRLEAS